MPAFARLLVPYDGSGPARAALGLALPLAREGALLTVLTVVDERTIVAESLSAVTTFDAAPLMEVLDARAKTLLEEAHALCKNAGITPALETVHDTPVHAITERTDSMAFDLVIMGTHAREGVARTFIGSSTEGVLRMSRIPVLTVRAADEAPVRLFATALVAIDDPEAADAPTALAAILAQTERTKIVTFHAPEPEDPGAAVIAAAQKNAASVIITGTHGRRGLHRLMLGSVAEKIVRTSPLPVLVVPMSAR